ncbi:serine protease Do-like HtrA [Oxobacter pfennigii]|uniref:Serine protease Do-like HtrA n=1 Tax=Oxobacter pfennigii TaxID=36849 RepID=A0A0P8YV52_9CLOT|nr:trypsin-like peptidase domain-containing protein [Oxobacter pfennigii]KPU43585.1 serine protease Do-like HtrA [Oxobacter pfennigii]
MDDRNYGFDGRNNSTNNDNNSANNKMLIPSGYSSYYVPKKKSNFKTYVAIILATSVISSSIVGTALYSRFSAALKEQAESLTAPASSLNYTASTGENSSNAKLVNSSSILGGFSVTQIAKKVGPSVVGIRMTVASANMGRNIVGGLPQSSGEGSGVIISSDGYIMTNYHVVEYADPQNTLSKNTTLEVFMPDGRQVKAAYVGGDWRTDLAVIKVDLKDLPVAELGDSSALEVGEQAVAIGNPLGMEFAGSVTAGVISALNRKVEMEDKTLNLIQTDAAINPGNSGGALVNSKGQVIGINTVKISVTGVEGLGFAIPMNDAKPIIEQLKMFGYVKGRPFIGISGEEVTEVISKQYGLPVGVYVLGVTAGSGAQSAGIQKGDIIVSLGGKEVKTMKDIDNIKKSYKAGDTVDAVIVRNNVNMNIKITFTEEK